MIGNLPPSGLILSIFRCLLGTDAMLSIYKRDSFTLDHGPRDGGCNAHLTPAQNKSEGGFEICEGRVVSYEIYTKLLVLRIYRKFICSTGNLKAVVKKTKLMLYISSCRQNKYPSFLTANI